MSNTLTIEKTTKTPYVFFDKQQGNLEIKGVSLPTNAIEFYTPLFQFIEEYLKKPQERTDIVFHFDYFNTSSSKILLQLLIRFESLLDMGKEVSLNWLYEEDDIDMLDAGKMYEASIKMPTILVPIA